MSGLNPIYTPKHKSWNYSKPDKEGYTEILVGTVVAIQQIQATEFGSGRPKFWSDGNPMFNIRLAVVTPDGELVTFTFQPASKAAKEGKKRSVHIDLWHLTGDTDLINLVGKTIMIQTEAGSYGANNPRPFNVSLVTDAGPYQLAEGELPEEFKLDKILIERPQTQQPQYQQQPQMMNNGYYAPPSVQQQYPQQPMQPMQTMQPMQQQYQQPMQQQTVPQMGQPQPPMPQGMDPNVAAAMQQMNATNVQPMQGGSVYDEQIPW